VVHSNCEECIFPRFVCVPGVALSCFIERDTRVVLLTFATYGYGTSAAPTVTNLFYSKLGYLSANDLTFPLK
jgi:hypothetical protein